jgi:hypothetical protein
MTRKRFHVTYDTVTPESAEHGDVEERGFVLPRDSLCDMSESPCGPAFVPIKAKHALTLREALDLLGLLESGGDGSSYYECDGRQNYRTGAETRYTFHLPDNATAASTERVARLLVSRKLIRESAS